VTFESKERPPLEPVLEFLRGHAPFDQMAPAHLTYLAKRLRLGFYPAGEAITRPEAGAADRFYIIKQGRIRGETGASESPEGAWELVGGECFPIGALLARRPVHTVNRAVEDTFCFELEREEFDHLLNQSPVFHDFCTRRLASLLDNALREVQTGSAIRASEESSLSAPVGTLIKRAPVVCEAGTPLRVLLARMEEARVGSVAVTTGNGRVEGIFTLHDVLSRVALPQQDLETPAGEVMTPDPITLPPDARAYEAVLLLARHGFSHICVVDRGALIGVLSERDLFALQRVGVVNLSRAIARAERIDTLAALERDVHQLIEQMLAQGASVDQLTQITTTLNDAVTRRVIELVLRAEGSLPPFTWLAFGSEGRHEQTRKTDQDNGILFEPPPGVEAEAVRATLLPVARRINEALARCGFPLCPGNIMAGNPECCLSLAEWQSRFARWIDQGTPEHLLSATVFFDFRPLWGDPAPAYQLREWLLEPVARNSRFRRQLAENALRHRPPLGVIRDFKVSGSGEHPHTLDLKVQGVTPFVDGARLFALAHRIKESNTTARLRAAVEAEGIRQADADAWCESHNFIQLLRMRTHRRQAEAGLPLSNHIDPDTLNDLDRRILKEAFRQARKLQLKLALDYQL